MDPYAKINCLTWSRNDNEWIVPGDQYNNKFKNWQGPIHNGHFQAQNLKKMIITEKICYNVSGSVKFNGTPR